MAIKVYKRTSPGRRNSSVNLRDDVTCSTPHKPLLRPVKRRGGRNHRGVITTCHRGGGHKRQYRVIDFRRDRDGVAAEVRTIERDPNRSCNIALVRYDDGEMRYILAPAGLRVGQKLYSGPDAEPRPGNTLPLRNIPPGLEIHNIELNRGQGGKLVRSAGQSARLSGREGAYAHVVLPSGEMRMIHVDCRATIGQLSNAEHQGQRIGKAGRKRHLGRRPHVRGSTMNPVDHPMGGGEGRRGGGRHPCSATGKLAKGGKTRKRRKQSNRMILRRRRNVRNGQLVL
ncbi:MAG: 50S ribosomal protein L2 [Phycisphaerae bacterium]|nr:50S ribosomal protein L2 [Phycisphaerae bacterium]